MSHLPVVVLSKKWLLFVIALGAGLGCADPSTAQVTREYLPGADNTVEMIVHIIGQVQKPGSYRVQDATNLTELLATAGGPTEFSNLAKVTVTHIEADSMATNPGSREEIKPTRIVMYDITKYLTNETAAAPPILQPGDIVFVPMNRWGKWRNLATIFRDLAVVVSAYLLYLRYDKA